MRRLGLLLACGLAFGCGDDSSGNPDGGGADATTDSPVVNPDGGGDAGDGGSPVDIGDSVITRSNHISRDALYVQPTFKQSALSTLALDKAFDGAVDGDVWAQVLFFEKGPNGKPVVIAATANDQVTAMDADTGAVVWQKTFGTPAGQSGAGCGNVQPLGITGTPAIDPVSRTIFFDAAVGDSNSVSEHQIHAISLDDGTERPNFPVKASTASYQGTQFDPPLENQRGAILYLNGIIYVPYGGHAGDCGQYHGWIIGVPYPNPSGMKAYAASIAQNTRAAGIWAPGGPASDGTDVFVTTGNTFGATTWVGQEAVLRLKAGPVFSNQTTDYWAPHDYLTLDNGDTDIGGTGAMLVDVPGATPLKLVLALGKSGTAYLVDRGNLGGIGTSTNTDGVSTQYVANGEIIQHAGHGHDGRQDVGVLPPGQQRRQRLRERERQPRVDDDLGGVAAGDAGRVVHRQQDERLADDHDDRRLERRDGVGRRQSPERVGRLHREVGVRRHRRAPERAQVHVAHRRARAHLHRRGQQGLFVQTVRPVTGRCASTRPRGTSRPSPSPRGWRSSTRRSRSR